MACIVVSFLLQNLTTEFFPVGSFDILDDVWGRATEPSMPSIGAEKSGDRVSRVMGEEQPGEKD